MSKRWEPQFDFYGTHVEADRAIVRLDLAAHAHAPVSTHPLRLTVTAKMRSPHADGLRSSEEAPAIFALEDLLVATLERALDAIFVSTTVARGQQQWTFYIPEGQQERGEAAVEQCGASYPLRTVVVADPQWSAYFASYPSPREMQTIWNRQLIIALQKRGDVSSIARVIDHRAYFPSESAALQATAALHARGYVANTPTATAERNWALDFTRSDACAHPLPDAWTAEIMDIIEPLDGDYDGWGCEVVTAPFN